MKKRLNFDKRKRESYIESENEKMNNIVQYEESTFSYTS